MGWTGGQYSLYRAALALAVARAICPGLQSASGAAPSAVGTLLVVLALLAATALGLGFRDRIAAGLLLSLTAIAELLAGGSIAVPSWTGLLTERSGLVLAGLLALHAVTPRAPYGAIDARERVDPRGGWQRPGWMTEVGWALLLFVTAASALAEDGPRAASTWALDVPLFAYGPELAAAGVGLAFRRARPTAWGVLVLWHLARVFAFGAPGGEASRLLVVLFAAEPGWWSGRSLRANEATAAAARESEPIPARLFYDGDCGFCHRSVRFILAEELATPAPLRLRFAPLGSATFDARLARHPELDPTALPDSIVLEREDGAILTRSAAALEIASRLGGFWRLVALIGSVLPRGVLDGGYDAIARVRKKLFSQPKDACPILPPDLRARFDA